jgi:hypothetical protein
MTALQIVSLFSMPIAGLAIAGGLLWFTRKAH